MLKVSRNGYGNCETEKGRREANLRPAHRARRGGALTFWPEIVDAGRGTPEISAAFCTLSLFALKKKPRRSPLPGSVDEADGKKKKWELLPIYSDL